VEPVVWVQEAFASFEPFMVKPDGNDGKGVAWFFPSPFALFSERNELAKKTFDCLVQLVAHHPECHFDRKGFVLTPNKEIRLLPNAICPGQVPNGKNLLEFFNVEEVFELGEETPDPLSEEECDFMRNRDPVLKAYLNRIGLSFERFAIVQRHTPEFERHLSLARCRINRQRYDVYAEQLKGELPVHRNPIYCQVLHDTRDPLYVKAMNGNVDWELNEKDKFYLQNDRVKKTRLH
jgi:hypothetical protein